MVIVQYTFAEGDARLHRRFRAPATMTLGDALEHGFKQLEHMSDGTSLMHIQIRPQFWNSQSLEPRIETAETAHLLEEPAA